MEINHNPFDFLNEIQKNNNYNLLFPSRQQGLAIMRLYTGIKKGIYPDKKFKEEDVCNALQISYISEDIAYTRIPQERFVEWIGELKEYFLVYDEENQVYFLKEYALEFCRHAEKILEANFNPTKIEVICSELKQRLEQVEADEEIRKWLDMYFDAFRPEMKSQVDFLDRQIDQAVLELRQTTSIQNESIINVLKQIDKELDHLKDQNKELRIAFQQMKQINDRLEQLSFKVTNAQLYEHISSARAFFPEIKYRLSLVDRRLDRIHPKLRQFFGTLNKPLFNVRLEKFLVFLLQHSTLEYKKTKRQVILPKSIGLPQVYIPTPHLPIIERRHDLFPVESRPTIEYRQNDEQIRKLNVDLKSKLQQHDEIEIWINKILEEVKTKKQVLFSKYFFSLAVMKDGNIELPIRLVHRLIRTSTYLPAFKIHVKEQLVTNEKIPGVTICEMSITLR